MKPSYIIIPLVILAALVLAVVCIRLFLLCPGKRKGIMDKYKNVKYAHRGYHGEGRAENSISAFRAARDMGYGIELDVRLSKDGELVVFHDHTLDRVTGVSGRVVDKTAAELAEIHLSGTEDTIPTFRQVLDLIDGAVPLLIEIKQAPGEDSPVEKLVELLEGYHGDYIFESFNPIALRRLRALAPDVPRGFLSTEYCREERFRGKLLYWALQGMYTNFLMRPDFIAYDKNGYAVKNLRYIRKTFDTPLLAWTIQSREEEETALGHGFDSVIFEGYPADK